MGAQDRSATQTGLPEGAKARRVYLLLRDEMMNGTYAPGASLPGEQQLAAIFAVSRVTIRRALEALQVDGLVTRRAGSGTVVLDRPGSAAMAADFTTLMPQLVQMGQTSARLLSFSYGVAPDAVADAMGLERGARVQTAIRVRLMDGTPFSHLTTHVPETIATSYSEAELAITPLFRLLERSGVQVEEAQQSVTAVLASPDVADALEVATGSPLLALRRVVRDAEGGGVEYLSAQYRPDLFRLDMRMNRVGRKDNRHWQVVLGDSDTKGTPA